VSVNQENPFSKIAISTADFTDDTDVEAILDYGGKSDATPLSYARVIDIRKGNVGPKAPSRPTCRRSPKLQPEDQSSPLTLP